MTKKLVVEVLKRRNEDRYSKALQFMRDKIRQNVDDEKIINLEKFLSNSQSLPRDSDNPFEDDIC